MLLGPEHYSLVEKLLYSNKARIKNEYDFSKGLFWINEAYLAKKNNQFIFGRLYEGRLAAIASVRLEYPDQGRAIVGNVFSCPTGLKPIFLVSVIQEAYSCAVEAGCHQIFSAVMESRFESQWKLGVRYSSFFSNFQISKYREIPPNFEPEEDWMRSILGRKQTAHKNVIRSAMWMGSK